MIAVNLLIYFEGFEHLQGTTMIVEADAQKLDRIDG